MRKDEWRAMIALIRALQLEIRATASPLSERAELRASADDIMRRLTKEIG